MFKAFGYIQLYAPHSTAHSSGRRFPMLSSHTTTLKPTTWVRCCVAHSNTLTIHSHARSTSVRAAHESFSLDSLPISFADCMCVRDRTQRKTISSNWLYVNVICSRAQTKWVNVDGNDDSSGSGNGTKSNHCIVDVNRELTMTSQIKWPPLPWNCECECECECECVCVCLSECGCRQRRVGRTILPFIRSNKRDDSQPHKRGLSVECCFVLCVVLWQHDSTVLQRDDTLVVRKLNGRP